MDARRARPSTRALVDEVCVRRLKDEILVTDGRWWAIVSAPRGIPVVAAAALKQASRS